jgi:adenine-specific DNA-methyltransferase
MKTVHEIWHGDSVELCEKFKPGKVNCVITDPPYGIDNKSKMAKTAAGKAYARKIPNDESPEAAIKIFQNVMEVLLPKTAENADLYVFISHQVIKEWLVMCDDFLPSFGFFRKAILIWEKDGPGLGDLISWGMGCEFILFFKKGRRPISNTRRNNVLHVPQIPPSHLIHPHEKPLPLLEELIRHSTVPGDFIVDPFGGSGSLARAAKRTGRNAVCIEYDETNYRLSVSALEGREDGLSFA